MKNILILGGFMNQGMAIIKFLFQVVKRVVKISVLPVLMTAIALTVATLGPQWHEEYLRNKVGHVVIRVVKDKNRNSGGTGFHVRTPSGQNYILTNAHVCAINNNKVGSLVMVSTPDGSRNLMRKIIDISEKADLCLVEAMPNYSGISLASNWNVGEQIAIVGHPLLAPLTVSRGQIISKTVIKILADTNVEEQECLGLGERYKFEKINDPLMNMFGLHSVCFAEDEALETNAITFPGNSGSPVVNFYGNLIGVIYAGSNRNNWGYMVPLHLVKDFLSVY